MGTVVIVLAGGSGSRMDSEVNKVYLPVADHPILEYSLVTFEASARVDEVILVVKDEDRLRADELIERLRPDKLTDLVVGGVTRHESETAGLEHIAPRVASGDIDMVAIHDGARPFASLGLIEEVVATAEIHGGAIPALPVHERMYLADGGTARPLPVAAMMRAQTPQAFRAPPLLDAYRAASRHSFTGVDTAETVERFSDLPVRTVPGDPRNIKITFIEDFFAAEDLAAIWKEGAWTR